MSAQIHRIAMWSGPRNISTALMRSWSNRPDTFVCDEPLYAHYLLKTGTQHPGANEVIQHGETDWTKVIAWLTGPVPDNRSIFYQKHMTHHLLPEIDRRWLDQVQNAFLIREPAEVISSLGRIMANPQLADTGFPQQVEIFKLVRQRTGRIPPVVDARDVLQHPAQLLRLLCTALDVDYTEAMLSWPPGLRSTDGIWAKYWYDAVINSTSFQPYRPKTEPVPRQLTGLLDQARELYQQLHLHRLGQ
jgi:hypothetical protein